MRAAAFLLFTGAALGVVGNYEKALVATTTASMTQNAPTAPQAAAALPATGTYAGKIVMHMYGPVQVEISIANGRIASVTPLMVPAGDERSNMLTAQAVPLLVARTLAAQSSQIDGVTGATLTSNAYRSSLQSAIDTAAGSRAA